MKVIQAGCLLLLLAVSAVAEETKPPTYPAPGVDQALTQGKTAKEFFASRAADTAGRAALAEARTVYQAEKDKLDAMIKAKESRDALDTQEVAVENSRYKLLLQTEECGPCATDEVKAVKVESPSGNQYWYILDGSYRIEAADDSQRGKKIQKLKKILLSVPAKKDRFRNVIDYVLVDNATGAILEDMRAIEHSPFYAFTSIGKPVFGAVLASDFYMKGVIETSKRPSSDFVIKTEVVPRPKNFAPPLDDYVSPSGKRFFTHHEIVRGGLGMTYLNSDGYLRVWSATNSGSDVEMVEVARTMMRRAHLDGLLQLEEMVEQDGAK